MEEYVFFYYEDYYVVSVQFSILDLLSKFEVFARKVFVRKFS